MKERSNMTNTFAMSFGAYMGVFWSAKFVLFPLMFVAPFTTFVFIALTLAVPFLGYYYGKQYRDKTLGGHISFSESFMFFFLMYAYASLIVAVAHYVYFQFIDNGFFIESYRNIIDTLSSSSNLSNIEIDKIKTEIDHIESLSPIQITINIIYSDVIICSIVALFSALILSRKGAKKES